MRLTTSVLAIFLLISVANGGSGWNYDTISRFCKKHEKPIKTTIQPNGKKANSAVLKFVGGKYKYPDGGAMLLFNNGYYIVKLPNSTKATYGTSGDDILGGRLAGGCSLEQLSEFLNKNSMQPDRFIIIKRYTTPPR